MQKQQLLAMQQQQQQTGESGLEPLDHFFSACHLFLAGESSYNAPQDSHDASISDYDQSFVQSGSPLSHSILDRWRGNLPIAGVMCWLAWPCLIKANGDHPLP